MGADQVSLRADRTLCGLAHIYFFERSEAIVRAPFNWCHCLRTSFGILSIVSLLQVR